MYVISCGKCSCCVEGYPCKTQSYVTNRTQKRGKNMSHCSCCANNYPCINHPNISTRK